MKPIKHRFRWGLALGGAIGYVAGTAAGRERFEELRETWHKMRSSAAVDRVEAKVKTFADGDSTFAQHADAPAGYDAELANMRGPGVNP